MPVFIGSSGLSVHLTEKMVGKERDTSGTWVLLNLWAQQGTHFHALGPRFKSPPTGKLHKWWTSIIAGISLYPLPSYFLCAVEAVKSWRSRALAIILPPAPKDDKMLNLHSSNVYCNTVLKPLQNKAYLTPEKSQFYLISSEIQLSLFWTKNEEITGRWLSSWVTAFYVWGSGFDQTSPEWKTDIHRWWSRTLASLK